MRTTLIAGNWKMNGLKAQNEVLLSALVKGTSSLTQIETAIFPPFVYLESAARAIVNSSLMLGAQNVSDRKQGALTGEVSADMLVDVGCRYVLVGHSERRALFGETNELVADKFLMSLSFGLTPILCVGETRQDYDAGRTIAVVTQQIQAVMQLLTTPADFVVAYEPVWAIGSGVTPTPEQAQNVHAQIRQQLASEKLVVAQHLRILYGGSVKPDNAELFLEMPDIDGVLVGGASLDANSFLTIARKAVR